MLARPTAGNACLLALATALLLEAIQDPSSHVAQATERLAASLGPDAVRLHAMLTPWLED